MYDTVKVLLLTLMLSALVPAAHAAPSLVGAANDITGIAGLVVGTDTSDVTFSETSATPTFDGNASGALAAANAMTAYFNQFGGPANVLGFGCPLPNAGCLIWTEAASTPNLSYSGTADPPAFGGTTWITTTYTPADAASGCSSRPGHFFCADYTLVTRSVPEPESLGLLAIGVSLLGILRRRRML